MTKQKHFGYVQLQKIRDIAVAKLRAKQKQELNAMAIKWHKEEQDMTKAILEMGKTPYFKWADWLKDAVHEWERKQVDIAKVFGIKGKVSFKINGHVNGTSKITIKGRKSTGRRISK